MDFTICNEILYNLPVKSIDHALVEKYGSPELFTKEIFTLLITSNAEPPSVAWTLTYLL